MLYIVKGKSGKFDLFQKLFNGSHSSVLIDYAHGVRPWLTHENKTVLKISQNEIKIEELFQYFESCCQELKYRTFFLYSNFENDSKELNEFIENYKNFKYDLETDLYITVNDKEIVHQFIIDTIN